MLMERSVMQRVKALVVPSSRRPPTKISQLEKQIEDIQRKCAHERRYFQMPRLEESKVEGVYIGGVGHDRFVLKAACIKCSADMSFNPHIVCPQCFGKMQSSHYLEGREKYHGTKYSYYFSDLYRCTTCNFGIVVDEWDR